MYSISPHLAPAGKDKLYIHVLLTTKALASPELRVTSVCYPFAFAFILKLPPHIAVLKGHEYNMKFGEELILLETSTRGQGSVFAQQ